MGEAKRRKKLLGEDYGQKESIVIVSSAELERHLLKFADAWTEKSEAMGDPYELYQVVLNTHNIRWYFYA